jgi:hypothetical protein
MISWLGYSCGACSFRSDVEPQGDEQQERIVGEIVTNLKNVNSLIATSRTVPRTMVDKLLADLTEDLRAAAYFLGGRDSLTNGKGV